MEDRRAGCSPSDRSVGVRSTSSTLVAHEERTEVTTYDAADVDVLDVDNSNGSVTIVGAAERDEITVTARISDGLRATGERQTLVDGRLELRASCPVIGSEWCDVKYTIEVPADIEVRAETDDGRLTVRGSTAPSTWTPTTARLRSPTCRGNLTINGDNGSITAQPADVGHRGRRDRQRLDHHRARRAARRPSTPARATAAVDVVLPDTEDVLQRSTSRPTTATSHATSAPTRTDPRHIRHRRPTTAYAVVRYAPGER